MNKLFENIMGKLENACNQHFLLFPHCFQRASDLGSLKVGIVWYRLNPIFDDPKKVFENIVEKLDNAGNQHFLLSPHNFLHSEREKKKKNQDLGKL